MFIIIILIPNQVLEDGIFEKRFCLILSKSFMNKNSRLPNCIGKYEKIVSLQVCVCVCDRVQEQKTRGKW
jgi:hypothetical protein